MSRLIVIAIVIFASALRAQTTAPATAPSTAPATQPTEYELTVHPMATPEPALKYQLAPTFGDQTPGDAAPLYWEAFYFLSSIKHEQSDEWLDLIDMPIEKFPVNRGREIVRDYFRRQDVLTIAARRAECHWNIPIREQGAETLLPQLNMVRRTSILLSLDIKVAIAERRYDDAIHDLETGIGMLLHFKDEACNVQALVASGCMKFMLDRIDELEQANGAPNLYWAFANLPPLVDLRATGEIERIMLFATAPHLNATDPAKISPQEFVDFLASISGLLGDNGNYPSGQKARLQMGLKLALANDPAKRWLKSHGYTDKQIDALPPGQAATIYCIQSYQVAMDENINWLGLPYWQGIKVSEGIRRIADPHGPFAANPLIPEMGLTARGRSYTRIAETRRRMAMMQIVEGLRAYAAAHDGKFPASLDDLVETPAPLDPMTGKAFEYRVTGSNATLHSDAPTDTVPSPMTFHIHMLPDKK